MQTEAHVGDDVAVGFILLQRAVEEAFAVAEAALGAGDLDEFVGLDGRRRGRIRWSVRPPVHRRRRSGRGCRRRSRGFRRGTRCRPCGARARGRRRRPRASPAATLKMPLDCCWMPRSAMCRTRPGKPLSRTSRLLPPPRTKSGRLRSRAHATAAAMSSSLAAVAKNCAGPPMPKVVYGASATESRMGRSLLILKDGDGFRAYGLMP